MRDCSYPMVELLPHAPPMILLDRVTGWDQGRLYAMVEIRSDNPFYVPGHGVPCHVGIEYMAQACGAYAGLEAKHAGQPVRIGFLLGTRHFSSQTPWFQLGEILTVSILEVLRESSMGVFDCRIAHDGDEVATARLNVYQPEDAAIAATDSTQGAMP